MTEDLFGRVVTGPMVEHAIVASLNKWIDTCLGKIERVDGWQPNQIQRPLHIVTQGQWDKMEEVTPPCILVMCQGLAGKPERHADGMHHASWLVGIGAIVSDIDPDSTRTLAGSYAAAIRLAILQHKRLKSVLHPDGFADYVTWHDETYADMPFDRTRTLGSARSVFEVGVENVITEFAGPQTPLADPTLEPDPLPTADTIKITAEPELEALTAS